MDSDNQFFATDLPCGYDATDSRGKRQKNLRNPRNPLLWFDLGVASSPNPGRKTNLQNGLVSFRGVVHPEMGCYYTVDIYVD
jgi:hypothetical protein